jgi:hypothetical protein
MVPMDCHQPQQDHQDDYDSQSLCGRTHKERGGVAPAWFAGHVTCGVSDFNKVPLVDANAFFKSMTDPAKLL